MKRVLCDDEGQVVLAKVAIWKERAIANMIFILNYLCKHYSRHLKDRVFLNCVVFKHNLANKTKKERLSSNRSAYMEMWRHGAEHFSTGSPPRVRSVERRPPGSSDKAKRQVVENDTVTDALDKFIELYLAEHDINLTEEVELKSVLEGNSDALDEWKEKIKKRKAQKHKSKKKKTSSSSRIVRPTGNNNRRLPARVRKSREEAKKDNKGGRRKTKRKKKRKKKTKRKKRRKRKKKTKKKR